MTAVRGPVEMPPGVPVPLAVNRELAVERWLLNAARDESQCSGEWRRQGITLSECGGLFAAVRIPVETVLRAAGTSDPDGVAAHLTEALNGGPVLIDVHRRGYYALVPASTPRWWAVPGAACLGTGSCLGVPRPDIVGPRAEGAGSYWVVPPDFPVRLCGPGAVGELVQAGTAAEAGAL